MTSLLDAIGDLYKIAAIEQRVTSTKRLDALAQYCVEQLERRGLKGVEREAELPGAGRPKNWDVAWQLEGKYRLAVSLKSMLQNISGTVPNRLDDLMGEVANVQLHSPEIVTGYLMVFDQSKDAESKRHGRWWSEVLKERLDALSGRSPPAWSTGMVEAATLIVVDFARGPKLLTPEREVERMFDILVEQVRLRNPSLQR